jgi:hypothetical protein
MTSRSRDAELPPASTATRPSAGSSLLKILALGVVRPESGITYLADRRKEILTSSSITGSRRLVVPEGVLLAAVAAAATRDLGLRVAQLWIFPAAPVSARFALAWLGLRRGPLTHLDGIPNLLFLLLGEDRLVGGEPAA